MSVRSAAGQAQHPEAGNPQGIRQRRHRRRPIQQGAVGLRRGPAHAGPVGCNQSDSLFKGGLVDHHCLLALSRPAMEKEDRLASGTPYSRKVSTPPPDNGRD